MAYLRLPLVMAKKPSYKKREENRGGELSDYWPLFSLILITGLAGLAITFHIKWYLHGLDALLHGLFPMLLCHAQDFQSSCFCRRFSNV